MTFDLIIPDSLWAVRYDGEEENAFYQAFDKWSDPIYTIKVGESTYIITGGAIKLTATMQEREHTLAELQKMEIVRNHLISEGVVDTEGFIDLIQTL
jgi:hypothetical protein